MKKLKDVFLLISAFLVSAFFISCSDTTGPIIQPPDNFNIKAYDYSDDHYFFDTIYKASFLDVFNNTTGIINLQTDFYRILSDDWSTFEVWVQTDITTINKRFAIAHVMLPEQPQFGYDTSYKYAQQVEGHVFSGFFRQLHFSEYYVYPDAGFISLKINVPENFAIGVTYRTNYGRLYGTPSSSMLASDTLILKMIKCSNQNPNTTPLAWELKLKNIYRLPFAQVKQNNFFLNPVYLKDGTYQNNLPGYTTSLSTMLDLDRYTGSTKNPPPDGFFDFLSGYTINKQTGDIIFPTLKPFWDNLKREGVDSNYYYKEIYTMRKTDAMNSSISPNAIKYAIKGHADGIDQ